MYARFILEFQGVELDRFQAAWKALAARYQLNAESIPVYNFSEQADAKIVAIEEKFHDELLSFVTPAQAGVHGPLDSRTMSRLPDAPPFASLKANAEGVVENWHSQFFRGNDGARGEVSHINSPPEEGWLPKADGVVDSSIKALFYKNHDLKVFLAFPLTRFSQKSLYYFFLEWRALYQAPNLALSDLPTDTEEKALAITAPYSLYYTHLYGRLLHADVAKLKKTSEQKKLSLPVILTAQLMHHLRTSNIDYPIFTSLINRFPLFPYQYDKALFSSTTAAVEISPSTAKTFNALCQDVTTQYHDLLKNYSQSPDSIFAAEPASKNVLVYSSLDQPQMGEGPFYAKMPNILYSNVEFPAIAIDYGSWEQAGQLVYRYSYIKTFPVFDRFSNITRLKPTLEKEFPEMLLPQSLQEEGRAFNPIKPLGLTLLGAGAATGAKASLQKKDNALKSAKLPVDRLGNLSDKAELASEKLDEIREESADANLLPTQAEMNTSKENQNTAEKTAQNSVNQAQQTNAQMNSTFAQTGTGLATLAASPAAFETLIASPADNTLAEAAENAPLSAEALAAHQENLAKLPENSPLNEFQKNLDELKKTDTSKDAKNPSDISAPSADTPAEEIEGAYENYQEKLMKMHVMPSASDAPMQKMDQNLQEMAMASVGSPEVSEKLKTQFDTLSQVSASIKQGDPQSSAAGLVALSQGHVDLTQTIAQQGGMQEGLLQKTQQLSESVENIESPESVEAYGEQVNAYEGHFDAYVSGNGSAQIEAMNAAQAEAEAGKAAAFAELEATPGFSQMKDKTNALTEKVEIAENFNCASLADEKKQAAIIQMKEEAEALKTSIPEPALDPELSEKMAAMKEKSEALNTAESAAKEKLAATQAQAKDKMSQGIPLSSEEMQALKDPNAYLDKDPGIRAAASSLDEASSNFAKGVQGRCPICSASASGGAPTMPAFKMPDAGTMDMSQLTQFKQSLTGLELTFPQLEMAQMNIPEPALKQQMQAHIDKVKGLHQKGTDLLSKLNSPSETPNPYAVLESQVGGLKDRLTAVNNKLAECKNYNAAEGAPDGQALKSRVEGAINDLNAAEEKLKALKEGSGNSASISEKMKALSEGLKGDMVNSASSATANVSGMADSAAIKSTAASMAASASSGIAQSARAKGTEKTQQAFTCWQSMQMPAVAAAGAPTEILVAGFQLKCPKSGGPPMPFMVPPTGPSINQMPIYTVTGVPAMLDMGVCLFVPNSPKGCQRIILTAGGSLFTKHTVFPVATRSTTTFMCCLGTKIELTTTGQEPSGQLPVKTT
jgi:hypothetical protein